jgi:hypothetical protein
MSMLNRRNLSLETSFRAVQHHVEANVNSNVSLVALQMDVSVLSAIADNDVSIKGQLPF